MGIPQQGRRPRRATVRVECLETREVLSTTLGVGLAEPAGVPASAKIVSIRSLRTTVPLPFTAKFAGDYNTSTKNTLPGTTKTFLSGGGLSNRFLHGDYQMLVVDPGTGSADNATATAALFVKNVSNSGNLLVLDLVGDPVSRDAAGRLTRFTWTVNDGSGGTFSGSQGAGTATIRYPKVGARGIAPRNGSARIAFTGTLATNGGVTDSVTI